MKLSQAVFLLIALNAGLAQAGTDPSCCILNQYDTSAYAPAQSAGWCVDYNPARVAAFGSKVAPGVGGSDYTGTTGVLDKGCNVVPSPKPSATGDPHFTTFGGEKYDFHGGCDLILLKNPTFANGLGLSAEIRTKIDLFWSYIETAVIQIGEFTLEITGGEGGWYWFNGEKEGHKLETGDASLGDYAVRFRRINDHQTQTRIDLGHGNAMAIESFKKFVRVNINPKNPGLEGSVGLLGAYPSGKMLARDGVTVIEDTNEFGQEWMVRPSEPMLFHDADESTERPLKCPMPDKVAQKEARRRLGESAISLEDAAQACARVAPADQDACIFDVMATNDKDLAGSY